MDVRIEKSKDFKELSIFLSKINSKKQSHIGFCGEKSEEIHRTLGEDFIGDGEVTFFEARNDDGEIVAAFGLDIDETSAEVWGPFNQTESFKVQKELWKELLNANPAVQTFEFLINKENTRQQAFMNEIKSKNMGEHLDLEVKEKDFDIVNEIKSVSFKPNDFQEFEKLHDTIFPNTYYDAKTIRERLNDGGNVLKLLKTDSNEIQGYAYYEADTEMEEAYLEYIGISDKFRNQGLGTMLLKEVLSEMFSYPQINEITLTVDSTSNKANHVYKKVGFKPKNVLISYLLEL